MNKLTNMKLIIINILLGVITLVLCSTLIMEIINMNNISGVCAITPLIGLLISGFFVECKWLHKANSLIISKDESIKEDKDGE